MVQQSQGTTLKIKIGSATAIKIEGFKDFSGIGGGAPTIIDVSDLDSTAKEKIVGLADEGQASFSFNYDPDDAGQSALEDARIDRTLCQFIITLPSGTTFTFSGYVLTCEKSAGVDAIVPLAVTVEITGQVVKGTAA